MKNLKEMFVINEASNVNVNVFVCACGSMNDPATIDFVSNFVNNNKATVYAFDTNKVYKVKSVKDIDFAGPHPADIDHVNKKMQDFIGNMNVIFMN